MTKPTPLKEVPAAPDQELVDTLRDLLVKAERGELLSLTYFGEMTGKRTFSGRAGVIQNLPATMFALESVKFRMMLESEAELNNWLVRVE